MEDSLAHGNLSIRSVCRGGHGVKQDKMMVMIAQPKPRSLFKCPLHVKQNKTGVHLVDLHGIFQYYTSLFLCIA